MLFKGILAIAIMFLLVAAAPVCRADPAPSLEGALLDGKPFHLADHHGHVVIIHFWAIWCTPCRAEMPVLNTYYRQHRKEGLDIVAISMDDRSELAKITSAMKSFSFPAALYEDMQAESYGRITTLPQTFLIGRDGILNNGMGDAPITDISVLEKSIAPLLAQKIP